MNIANRGKSRVVRWSATCAGLLLLTACSRPSAPEPQRPNIIWIVWDTVRADRMSLYGHNKPTTPNLDRWATGARVYTNCISASPWTVPSHASMFTGMLPTEHGTNADSLWLDDRYDTLAERLKSVGYQTYLWAGNPHISDKENFHQGFDVEEHPWLDRYRDDAVRIVRDKARSGEGHSEMIQRLNRAGTRRWDIKASGKLAQRGVIDWLTARDPQRPFFAFLNYMEAHRPLLPSEEHRRRVMSPELVSRSYHVDRTWDTLWKYTFGIHDYPPEDLEAMAGTYDATIVELDELFAALLEALEAAHLLDNTMIVLTADHGEHLGEHHRFDHQFSLYQPLLRVPLILYYPASITPGRDDRPAINLDLFKTLANIAQLDLSPQDATASHDLLAPPPSTRPRLSEYMHVFPQPFQVIKRIAPDLDTSPWRRSLRAYTEGDYKLIWASNGTHELYNIATDPLETDNLFLSEPDRAAAMLAACETTAAALPVAPPPSRKPQPMSEEQRRRLQALGYTQTESDDDEYP